MQDRNGAGVIVSLCHLRDVERTRVERITVMQRAILVGRSPGCTIVIYDDTRTADEYVRITVRADDMLVNPLTAGIRLGGTLLTVPRATRLGVPIQIGERVLVIRPAGPAVDPGADWSEPTEVSTDTVYDPTPPEWGKLFPPQRTWRAQLASDPVEHDLLAALRDRPSDATTRMVYADWLEQHGQADRSLALRGGDTSGPPLPRDSDVAWRAITSTQPIDRCTEHDCPKRWHRLLASDDERRRYCGTCLRAVWYCTNAAEIRLRVMGNHPIVLDAALFNRTIDGDRLDAILRRVVRPDWAVSRSGDHWRVNPVWCEYYTVVLNPEDLRIQYGGIEFGPTSFDEDEPPIWTEAVLPLAGLDDADIASWLEHAFGELPPTEDRNF
ncbi:MAG TPA: TIGR02996 domain-containing protein [Kofleriaceae bacterium]|nr:TIGR02996 domain-containing protein [Kofleriaceae bacterium]